LVFCVCSSLLGMSCIPSRVCARIFKHLRLVSSMVYNVMYNY
jgi:hypothetical protein